MKWDILICIILVFLLILLINIYSRRNGSKDQYDERQELIRGRSYKYSALTMFACALIYYLLANLTEKQFMEDGVSAFLIALIGIGVFAVYSITHDSFFGIKGKRAGTGSPGIYAILLGVIAIGDIFGAVGQFREGRMIENGMLTGACSSLALAVLFLAMLVSMGIKYLINRKEVRGDD